MGQGRFELPSKRPKRSRMDQATLLPLYLHTLGIQTKIVADEGEVQENRGFDPSSQTTVPTNAPSTIAR
jgi:hypothetical protein